MSYICNSHGTNESWHIWMNHGTYEWVMSHTNESILWICRHQWMTHTTGMNESCHLWVSHGTDESVIPMNMQTSMHESCHTYEWVMARMNESLLWICRHHVYTTEPIGVSFSTKRQTDGPTKVERISTMYDGMGLAYHSLSRGFRKESNTNAHE